MTENKQLMSDLIGQRQLNHCPPHFETVTFNPYTNERFIINWIWENLAGRFYFGDYYHIPDGKKKQLELCKAAAFEIHGEASYFAMNLTEINKFR